MIINNKNKHINYCLADGAKDMPSTTQAIFMEGEEYKGKKTEIYGYLGIPKKSDYKSPAIILVHGGGGCAESYWVDLWVKKGFVTIALDYDRHKYSVEKGGYEENENGGPNGYGDFKNNVQDLKNTWTYQSVSNTLKAFELLSDFEFVDSNKVGIAGISWGGYIALISLSKEKRFAFGSISYTSAYLYEDSFWHKNGFCNLDANYKRWIKKLDPKNHISTITAPLLFVRGVNDSAFSVKSWSKTLKLIKSEKYLSVYHNLVHEQFTGSNCPEIFEFVESILNKKKYHKFIKENIQNDLLNVIINSNIKINNAELIFTISKDADDHNWIWEKQIIVYTGKKISLKIDEYFTAFYILLTTEKNLKFSSKIYYNKKI